MSRIIICLNYLSAICAIALGFLAVDIYSDQQQATKIAIAENAAKTEALYVALTGRHGIRLSNQGGSNE
tara:strand:+ start:1167 stop:1373 length:207 start_codon:yes stop_codon:yes gene_type:complete